MFRRLLVSDLMNYLSLASFVIFFVIFIAIVVWAVRLPRERIAKLESLPLESSDAPHE